MKRRSRAESLRIGRRIAERRRQLGMSQESLADRLGVSRQLIGAVESGRSLPSVWVALELARALNTTVEDLFGVVQEEAVRWGDPDFDPAPGLRVRFARVDGQLVAYPLKKREAAAPVDGMVGLSGYPEPLSPECFQAADRTVAIAGCDPALTILREWAAETGAPVRIASFTRGSEPAVRAMAEGRVHLAGVHGAVFSMLEDIRKSSPPSGGTKSGFPEPLVCIHFARWEVGIAVAPANPKGVTGLEDLARPDLRWVSRPAGTAVGRLYEETLARLPEIEVRWSPVEADDHIRAAEMIASGMADAGLTTSFAAHLFNLSFLPVEEHSFDLLVPLRRLAEPPVSILADLLRTAAFRRQMETLWGYDVSRLGDVSEVEGAIR
ncbi:MAG: substrate-binding domain-containing protein [Alicyclobacillaceae bacterium]|nr:substrate-binding domain-containing protein [Alicyclobacillaceae bacterium]